jgi:hypothetical protein
LILHMSRFFRSPQSSLGVGQFVHLVIDIDPYLHHLLYEVDRFVQDDPIAFAGPTTIIRFEIYIFLSCAFFMNPSMRNWWWYGCEGHCIIATTMAKPFILPLNSKQFHLNTVFCCALCLEHRPCRHDWGMCRRSFKNINKTVQLIINSVDNKTVFLYNYFCLPHVSSVDNKFISPYGQVLCKMVTSAVA